MNCYTNIPEAKKQSVRKQAQSEGLPLQIAPVQPITWHCVLKRALGMGLRLRFRKAAAFTLRLMVYPQTSLRWYGFLADFSRKHRLGLPHDDLIRKAIPNFFLHKASLRERAHWLQNHFALAGQYMAQEDLQQLWTGKRLRIAAIEGKRELYDLSLCLSDHAGARHEGGFTISLHRRRDRSLWPTAPLTGWFAVCGQRTVRGNCAWRMQCRPDRCSSTIMVQAEVLNCLSVG